MASKHRPQQALRCQLIVDIIVVHSCMCCNASSLMILSLLLLLLRHNQIAEQIALARRFASQFLVILLSHYEYILRLCRLDGKNVN